ncbi:MAG: glycosyltransferase family 2 protein [Candidatus Uhrbacteria bacterium]
MAKVSLNIVTWNGLRYLPELLDSLDQQTFRDFKVRVIDNGSDDGTVEYLSEQRPDIMLVRNVKNHGFAAGHNQAMRFALDRWSETEQENCYVLCCNQDIILTPDFLLRIVEQADNNPKVGAFCGKLLRAYGENLQDEILKETVQSERIDSTGLRANRWRRFTDRGAGEMDQGQYDQDCDIFGVSGALALYRASVLSDIKLGNDYFDEDFFSYREDVDLAWRIRTQGWEAHYVPRAVAYHWRGIYGKEKAGVWTRITNRRKKRPFFAAMSTRNQWFVLLKNEHWLNCLLSVPLVVPLEFLRLCYMMVFEPRSLWILSSFLKLFPKMFKKRLLISKKRRVKASEIRYWLH